MTEQDEKDETWPEELVEIKIDSQAQGVQRRAFKHEDSGCPEEVTGKEKDILCVSSPPLSVPIIHGMTKYHPQGPVISQNFGTKTKKQPLR